MRTALGWRALSGLAVLGFLMPPGAARAEEKPRAYENRLTPIAKPQPLLADYPEFIEPVKEIGRFEAPTLVDDPGADLHVRAWRFSYNARGIIEMPNRLRADRTAVIMVHPWGVDDGQGWKTPEPAGVVDFCTPAKNQLAGRHTRKVVNPFLKSLRGKVALVMYSLPGKEDAIRKKLYRSFRAKATAADRAQGTKELVAKLKGFSYKGQALPRRLTLSADRPVVDYFREFPGLDSGPRYNNAGFWDLPIPVTRDIDVDPDDVVIYDAEGYPALKTFLNKQGIRHILLTGYATDMCFCRTTAGYKNLAQDFNVFLVGDATLATFPANAGPRSATNAAISFAALDQLVTQVSWIKYEKGKGSGRKSTRPQRQRRDVPSLALRAAQAVCFCLTGLRRQQLGQVRRFHSPVPAPRGQHLTARGDGRGRDRGGVDGVRVTEDGPRSGCRGHGHQQQKGTGWRGSPSLGGQKSAGQLSLRQQHPPAAHFRRETVPCPRHWLAFCSNSPLPGPQPFHRRCAMRVPLFIALTASLLITGDALSQRAVKGDQEKMQGTWTVAAEQISGKKLTAKEIENLQVVIRGNRLTFKDEKNHKKAETLTFQLDPTQKPKAIDFTRAGDKKSRGIYKLEDDQLTICYAINAKKRPTEFQTKVGGQQFLFVLKRAKR